MSITVGATTLSARCIPDLSKGMPEQHLAARRACRWRMPWAYVAHCTWHRVFQGSFEILVATCTSKAPMPARATVPFRAHEARWSTQVRSSRRLAFVRRPSPMGRRYRARPAQLLSEPCCLTCLRYLGVPPTNRTQ